MRFLVIGETSLLIRCVNYLLEKENTIVGCVSGDVEISTQLAGYEFKTAPSLQDFSVDEEFDFLLSIVNYATIPEELLKKAKIAAINFHDGPLPKYAGINATAWALANQEIRHGASWHLMTEIIDAGDVLVQKTFPLSRDDTSFSANLRCFQTAYDMFVELEAKLAKGDVNGQVQDLSKRSYYEMYKPLPNGGVIDWDKEASEVEALFRATQFGAGHPNTFGTLKISVGKQLLMPLNMEILSQEDDDVSNTGALIKIEDDSLIVKTKKDYLRLSDLRYLDNQLCQIASLVENGELIIGQQLSEETTESPLPFSRRYEKYWVKKIVGCDVPTVPFPSAKFDDNWFGVGQFNVQLGKSEILAAFIGWLDRVTAEDNERLSLWYSSEKLVKSNHLSPIVPLIFEIEEDVSFPSIVSSVEEVLASAEKRGTFLQDVYARFPNLANRNGNPKILVTENLSRHQLEVFSRKNASLLTVNICTKKDVGKFELDIFTVTLPQFQETVKELFVSFRTLLAAVADNQNVNLNELPLLSAETQRLLDGFNKTDRTDIDLSETVVDWFDRSVKKYSSSTALKFKDQTLTYQEFDQRSAALARWLKVKGCRPGDTVAVMSQRSIELLVGIWGVLRAGAGYMPIDLDAPEERLNSIFAAASCNMVVAQSQSLSNRLDGFKNIQVLDLEGCNWDEIGCAYADQELPQTKPEDPSYVLFTSGTTGVPKGVKNTHKGLLNRLIWYREYLDLSAEDIFLQKIAYTFDVSVSELSLPFMIGATLEIAEPEKHKDPEYIYETIRDKKITLCHFVPTLLDSFLEYLRTKSIEERAESLASLKHVHCSGEALIEQSRVVFNELLPQAYMYNMYGPAEAAIEVTFWKLPKSEKTHRVLVGPAVPNTQLYVLDKAGRQMPPGAMGELFIGGVQLAEEYVGRPDLTADKFIPNPFGDGRLYTTGDVARRLVDGSIDYIGRADTQIKLGGVRIELEEIETVLRKHENIQQAAVVIQQSETSPPFIVAYVTPLEQDTAILEKHLSKYLSAVMIPRAIIPLVELPVNKSGKLDRKLLPRARQTELFSTALIAEDQTLVGELSSTEEKLRKVFAETLSLEEDQVPILAPWKELGLNSLLMLRMQTAASQHGFRLPLGLLSQNRSIRSIATALDISGEADRAVGEFDPKALVNELESIIRDHVSANDQMIVIHSSISNLGLPEEVVRPMLIRLVNEWVASGVTVVAAAYNFDFTTTKKFHWADSASQVGVFCEWLMESIPNILRTPHPIYSWVAVGPLAKNLANMPNKTTFGDTSSFAYIESMNARYLMLGTHALTQGHRYEELSNVPYRYYKKFEGVCDYGNGPEPDSCAMYVRDLNINPWPISHEKYFSDILINDAKKDAFGETEVLSVLCSDVRRSFMKVLEANPFCLLTNAAEVAEYYRPRCMI
ncbi:MAG: amino acid adenylation domain-containing protein [Rhodospirillales bacterium]|nr:amino acid adenylation domain-containing protein [Rhodospirillales bacterium]